MRYPQTWQRAEEIRKVQEKQEKIEQIKRDFYALFTLEALRHNLGWV